MFFTPKVEPRSRYKWQPAILSMETAFIWILHTTAAGTVLAAHPAQGMLTCAALNSTFQATLQQAHRDKVPLPLLLATVQSTPVSNNGTAQLLLMSTITTAPQSCTQHHVDTWLS
ncbi:hypothetical protein COO60DRAFT_255545 [Scenedesmus sp. NREL 46B-D3]|nr:hypothetical protein COO60DRAFT_255545 [Scenedesmus sp. NREL 46B-D3]